MTLLNPFSGTETLAEQPLDQDLMDQKIRANLEDLALQIDNISVGGGGGVSGDVGEIQLGGETNEGIYWKRRFHPLEHMLNADPSNPSGFDPEGVDINNEMLSFIQSNDVGLTLPTANAAAYLGQNLAIAKDSSLSFKVKKGVNFFNIGHLLNANRCDNVIVTIDGNLPSVLGLVDENGNATGDSFSMVNATNLYQTSAFYFGLDGEEHVITIDNQDSGTDSIYLDFIEVGFRTNDPTINEDVNIKAGIATVRGAQVSFDEADLTFGKLNKNGHTAGIKCDSAGLLTAVDGESPAMTQCKPQEAVAFSSAVTQLQVKNNWYFPDNGICLLSTPHGAHYMFSYTGKTATTIQAHTLDDLLWQSQPTEDFTPLDNFETAVAADATGDLNINLWGTAPILIDSSNNKLDFKVVLNGVTTTHAATIANGRYAADLVPLEKAIRTAMQAVKSIDGEYHVKYNADTQLWSVYLKDDEITELQLLLSSGVNVANSIHSTLGFASTDLTGDTSYVATTEKQHLCCRVMEKDSIYIGAEDPRIKYSDTASDATSTAGDIMNRLDIGNVRLIQDGLMQVFPDDDCCGMEFSFVVEDNETMMTYQIDDGQCLYLTQADSTTDTSEPRSRLVTSFISFPRGSRKITIRGETSTNFHLVANTEQLTFAGCRQYFTKPAYEKLTLAESFIKTFEISPISLYGTIYGNNGGNIYSPAAQDDNINTITESGTWTSGAATTTFNGSRRRATISGAYVEYDFTLIGDGGGLSIKTLVSTIACRKLEYYISQSAIVEGTDKVQICHLQWVSTHLDQDFLKLLGLPAGTYKVRIKLAHSGQTDSYGATVYDTVSPQENANTVTDINNTGQGVSYPVNVRRSLVQQDSGNRVPSYLERSGVKEGRVSNVNYSFSVPSFTNTDDSSALTLTADRFYGFNNINAVTGTTRQITGFYKSVTLLGGHFSTRDNLTKAFVDGIQTLNTYSNRVQVKGGSAPSATRLSSSRSIAKEFKLSCVFSAGDLFTCSDTRGLKNDMTIILDDGTNKEKAQILSFVVGVSFTVKKARAVVIDANVAGFEFQGFHNFLIEQGSASILADSCFGYEPLDISPSNALVRRNQTFKYEKVSRNFDSVANGNDLYYPVHSDGVSGSHATSNIEVKASSAGSAYNFPQNLKNISVTSGTLDVRVTSERLVPVLTRQERFM